MLAVRTLAASAAASAPVQARGVASAAPEPRLQPRHHEDCVAQRLGAPGLAAAMSSGQDRELQDQLDQLQEHEVRLPVPWGHIAGKWWGRQDRRPLVALHGWGDNAGSFQRLAGSLRGVPVLALDLPGHGLSSHPPRGLAPADRGLLLAALRRVHRALGLTAMSLVGHSLGDALALLYAATYPAEVDMYVSLDTLVPCPVGEDAVVKSSGPLTDELLEVEMTLDRKVEPKSPSPHPESLPFLLSTRGGSLNRHAAGMLLQRGVASGGASTLDPRVVRAPVLDTALALACARAVRCPTLCVLPEWRAPRALAADPELRARFLAELRMAAKSVATVSVTGTHHVHLNSPEVVVPALCDFLDQHYCRQEHAVPTATFAV